MRRLSRRSQMIIGGLGLGLGVMLLVLFLIWPAWAYHLDWTGFGASRGPTKSPKALFDYYPSKTLWDWMQLLLIPAVLVVAGFLLNSAQQRRERDIAKENRARDLDIADKNRAQDRATAEDRQQEAALGEYLATMTTLLLDKELKESTEGSEVRAVARAQTLTVLRRLNGERKGAVVQFLYESALIDKDKLIVDLLGANLLGAALVGAALAGVNLARTILTEARLLGADLTDASLRGCDVRGCDVRGASMARADLERARLINANLAGANLAGANLTRVTGTTPEQLAQAASLDGAIMPDGSIHP